MTEEQIRFAERNKVTFEICEDSIGKNVCSRYKDHNGCDRGVIVAFVPGNHSFDKAVSENLRLLMIDATPVAPTTLQIASAINNHGYVTWVSKHGVRGYVIGISPSTEYLTMVPKDASQLPFRTGYEQAVRNGYVFEIRGREDTDWAS